METLHKKLYKNVILRKGIYMFKPVKERETKTEGKENKRIPDTKIYK